MSLVPAKRGGPFSDLVPYLSLLEGLGNALNDTSCLIAGML
jgi:hypothetical protein